MTTVRPTPSSVGLYLADAIFIASKALEGGVGLQALLSQEFECFLIFPSDQKKKGRNVSEMSIESLLLSLDALESCLCVRISKQTVKAFIRKEDRATQATFQDLMKEPKISSNFTASAHRLSPEELDDSISEVFQRAILSRLNLEGWINLGFPEDLDGKGSPTAKLLVKMDEYSSTKSNYDAVLVDVTVKESSITVAFDPVSLFIRSAQASTLLQIDDGKLLRLWNSGGVVDFTIAAENTFCPCEAACCFTLGGLRRGSLLAISKSSLSDWLKKQLDEDIAEDEISFEPETDAVYKQLVRIPNASLDRKECCIFRHIEYTPTFAILPLACVIKSYLLQVLPRAGSRRETIVSKFLDGIHRASRWINLSFESALKSVKLHKELGRDGEAFQLVPRAVPCIVNMPAFKNRKVEAPQQSALVKNPAANRPKPTGPRPDEVVSRASNGPEKSCALTSVTKGLGSKSSGPSIVTNQSDSASEATKLNSSPVVSAPSNAATNTGTISLKFGGGGVAANTEKVPAPTPGDSERVEHSNEAAKESGAKKRKEAPTNAEDLTPSRWEGMMKDGGIQKMTVPAMKLFLTSVKLPVSGKKEVLIERLRKHFNL